MEFIKNDRKIFSDFESERAKKMTSLCSDSTLTEKQFLFLLDAFGRKEDSIRKALEYAKGLDFSKNHLKSSYFSHPLRLASFLLETEPGINAAYIVIALLHNVPETTEITVKELQAVFGEHVANGIDTLVVDRKAVFETIEEEYYKMIFAFSDSLVLVKLFDKIDNLFVLCLNADDEVRKNYIDEIRRKLLPFAAEYNAQLGIYLDALLEETSALGYSPELKGRLTAYQQSLQN